MAEKKCRACGGTGKMPGKLPASVLKSKKDKMTGWKGDETCSSCSGSGSIKLKGA
jgi:hypothetical protein